MAAVTDFGAQENKICHCFHFFPIYFQEVMVLGAMTLVFWMLSFKPAFSFSSFTFINSVQSLSHVRLCDPMGHSMPGLPVHHELPEFTQTHVHWVSDAIQPSHPLSSPSPPSFNLSQHQGLFQWVSSSLQVASDFGTPKNKISHCFHCFPIYLPWSDGTRCHKMP